MILATFSNKNRIYDFNKFRETINNIDDQREIIEKLLAFENAELPDNKIEISAMLLKSPLYDMEGKVLWPAENKEAE